MLIEHKRWKNYIAICLSTIVLFSAGCFGKRSQVPIAVVTGDVKYDDKPLTEGFVTFLTESGFSVSANLGKNGEFELASQHGKGIPLGEYVVTVTVPQPGEIDPLSVAGKSLPKPSGIKIPARYRSPKNSGITATIKDGKNVIPIVLEAK